MRSIVFMLAIVSLTGLILLSSLMNHSSAQALLLPSGTPSPATELSVEVMVEQGRQLYRAGRLRAALYTVNQVLEQTTAADDVSLFRAHFLRGQIYLDMEAVASAVTDLTQAIELQPEISEVYAYRAQAYLLQGNTDDALVDYEMAISYDASAPTYYIARGDIYLQTGEFELALEDYNQALALDPQSVAAYHHRGMAYAANTQYRNAIVDFDTALELDPEYAASYRERGYVHLALDENALALADFELYLEKDPAAPDREAIEVQISTLQAN